MMRETYQGLLQGMIGMFQAGVGTEDKAARTKAMTIATLCIGGMVASQDRSMIRRLPTKCARPHEH